MFEEAAELACSLFHVPRQIVLLSQQEAVQVEVRVHALECALECELEVGAPAALVASLAKRAEEDDEQLQMDGSSHLLVVGPPAGVDLRAYAGRLVSDLQHDVVHPYVFDLQLYDFPKYFDGRPPEVVLMVYDDAYLLVELGFHLMLASSLMAVHPPILLTF